ncbi:cell wall-binding repeat-containing protein [Fictibacillus halophilus]|uniref:cell wall-binding repeat-containing protein n=1 Tax=Fictibacillus halophilus TaxID=1610490 RepID=UPI001CFB5DBB|nr:cell wall-binding repeat-containing protein [Fictibacillus halophilus]
MKKIVCTLFTASLLFSGFSVTDTNAASTTVSLDPDDVRLKMVETEFGSWSVAAEDKWSTNELVDRFEFTAGQKGLSGNLSFRLERSWDSSENKNLESTLFAQLKNGQYIKIFTDPPNDDALTIYTMKDLNRNEEIKKHGGINELTGKFIFEMKRYSNLNKEYTYDLLFKFEENNNFIRYGGKDRFEVEKNLNNEIPNNSLDSVIITSGLKYSDALVGSVLNKKKNGTLLLISDKDDVIQEKIAEAKRLLKPSGKVYILGGTGTVSTKIESEFKKHFSLERIAGKDRLEVALKIADITNSAPTELFLVYGLVFSDALSVAPVATERQTPILPQWGRTLKPEIKEYLKQHPSIKKVYVVSGTGVVPVSVEDELKSLGVTNVERIAGKDRYETSYAIAKKFYPKPNNAALANGLVFADALSGSRHAWVNKGPVVLVQKDYIIPNSMIYLSYSLKRIWLLGGPATITEKIKQQIY